MGFTDAKGAELKVEFSNNPNLAWNAGGHTWEEISAEVGKLDVSGGDKQAEEFKTFASTEISTSNPGMQNIALTAVFRNALNTFLDYLTDSWDGTEGETFYLRWAYQKGATGAKEEISGIAEMALRNGLEELHNDANWAKQMINLMKHRAGLLLEKQEGVFAFPHRTFQEYLAGVYLSGLTEYAKEVDQLAIENWSLWREVILLSVGRLVHGNRQFGMPLLLIEQLLENDQVGAINYWRKVWLAGEIALEMGLDRLEKDKLGQKRLLAIRKKLEELVSTGQLEPKERLLAGEVLGEIGDSRPGVGVTEKGFPDIEFCYIPAGPFWMGSSEEDKEADEREKPQHLLNIPYGYWLSKYLVTVGQYRAFVQATGYTPTDPDSLRGLPSQPVNNVTWREALKFCGWLTEISQARGWLPEGYKIILPSEAEWEKGARGGLHWPITLLKSQKLVEGLVEPSYQLQAEKRPTWRYPWGNEFDTDCALTKETGFNNRGVVGAYPRGRSPYGLWDMSGNVWEWTRSIWGKGFSEPDYGYPYQAADGREDLERPDNNNWLRVVRGCGYFWNAQNARSVSRLRFIPGLWSDNRGFRLCVSRFSM